MLIVTSAIVGNHLDIIGKQNLENQSVHVVKYKRVWQGIENVIEWAKFEFS